MPWPWPRPAMLPPCPCGSTAPSRESTGSRPKPTSPRIPSTTDAPRLRCGCRSRAPGTWRSHATATVSSGWRAFSPTASAMRIWSTSGRSPSYRRQGIATAMVRLLVERGAGPARRAPDRRRAEALRVARLPAAARVLVARLRALARQRRQQVGPFLQLRMDRPPDAPDCDARRRRRRRGADEGVRPGALSARLRRAAGGERRRVRRAGRPAVARATAPTSSSRATARWSPAAAGAGATGCTRAAATRTTTPACSTPPRSRRGCARCSSAPTGRAAASAAGSSRSARRPRARDGFSRLVLNATLAGVPLYEAYGFAATGDLLVTMPDGVGIPCVAMEKEIATA